jgi:hypothetical protein
MGKAENPLHCYDSVPSNPGVTGVRSYSGISSGAIFVDTAGAPIACPVPAGTTPLGITQKCGGLLGSDPVAHLRLSKLKLRAGGRVTYALPP